MFGTGAFRCAEFDLANTWRVQLLVPTRTDTSAVSRRGVDWTGRPLT